MNQTKWTFEDLEVWQEGRKLRQKISACVKASPAWERNKLVDQMIRASRSITANIAEGYGRFHYQENIQFCRQARGSLYELVDHVIVAYDEQYIKEEEMDSYKNSIYAVIKKLNGYIKYLQKCKDDE